MAETRRGFLNGTNRLLAVAGFSKTGLSAAGSTQVKGEDYYAKLGVPTIINAAGTYTALTASIMPPSVQAAVALAAKHPVRLL